jgi:hypothetical protein
MSPESYPTCVISFLLTHAGGEAKGLVTVAVFPYIYFLSAFEIPMTKNVGCVTCCMQPQQSTKTQRILFPQLHVCAWSSPTTNCTFLFRFLRGTCATALVLWLVVAAVRR